MRNKLAKSVEFLWIATSILCLISGIHQTIYQGFSKSYVFFIFSLLAFLMFLIKRHIRKTNNAGKTNG